MGKKSISKETREKIVTLSDLGIYSYASIAEMCHVSKKCVFTTLKNFRLFKACKEKHRSGGPRKTTERDDRELLRMVRADPSATLYDLSQDWKIDGDKTVSRETVRRRLAEFELESHVAAEKPLLTDAHKKARLEWCKKRRDWGYGKWAEVIFSDESNFKVINRKTRPKVWRYRNEKYAEKMVMPRKQGGGGSLGIWGCIGELGAGCCTTFPGRMNQWRYLDVIEDHLKPSFELLQRPGKKMIFQQDGATCHTAKRVKEKFKEENIEVMTWPANSPDLSPIENIWVEIDKKLARMQIASMTDLEEALHKCWSEITRQDILSQLESMPDRIQAVIAARGGYTKY